jgi:hypothetical protein
VARRLRRLVPPGLEKWVMFVSCLLSVKTAKPHSKKTTN